MQLRYLALVVIGFSFLSCSQDKEYFLLVGNPGTGKSTLINSLIGKEVAHAGLSLTGSGITKKMQVFEHNNRIYIDTPGLDEDSVQERLDAAKEIEKALKFAGSYRIFFVFTLEAGRIKPADVATLNLVMNAIGKQDKKYNIIVNKLEKKLLGNKENIRNYFNSGENKTNSIYLLPFSSEINNNLLVLDDAFKQWFYNDSLSMPLEPKDISEPSSDVDKKLADYEKEIKRLQDELKNK
jgi:GTPase Era involved in 16S rRNA processing